MTDTPVVGAASGNDTAEKSLPPEESGRRGAPRLREIMRRQRRDSDVSNLLTFPVPLPGKKEKFFFFFFFFPSFLWCLKRFCEGL